MKINTIEYIHNLASNGKIRFKKHALIRVVERNIKIKEIEEALKTSRIIESYPEDKPLESHLLLGTTKEARQLHIVVALDKNSEYIWIVTAYDPDKAMWNRTLTKRKL